MSASRPANMRASRGKTPLLLLLLVWITLTGTALCQDEEVPDDVPETPELDPPTTEETSPQTTEASEDPDEIRNVRGEGGSGTEDVTGGGTDDPDLDPTPSPGDDTLALIIIPVLVALVVVIIGVIVCGIFLSRRWNRNKRNQELRKEDPYLDGPSSEKVPMPMFEDDIPSVQELEMEEMDQWMKKDGDTAEDSNHAGF